MQKIPTLFKRDPDNMKHVLPEVTPGCEWVLAGEGVATRKYDGTCCMYDGSQWWARREVKANKPSPPGFIGVDHDPNTGNMVGWVPMESSSFAKWHAEAVERGFKYRSGTYELIGPKINGNPEHCYDHQLVEHSSAPLVGRQDVASFQDAKDLVMVLGRQYLYEGVVWHHPDGRMAKLKYRDFT